MCKHRVVVPLIGIDSRTQDEMLSPDAMFEGTCEAGHKSVYFVSQLIEVCRKLSSLERATEPELIEDDRFRDIQ